MTNTMITERGGAAASVVRDRPDELDALDLPAWRRIGCTAFRAERTPRCER